MKLRCIPITAVLLTTIFVCLGCDRSPPPLPPLRILTFITKWPDIPPGQLGQLRQDLDNGNRTLADVQFGRLTCEFVNDAAATGRVSVNLNGMPGDPNLNFSFVSGLHRAQNLGNCIPGTNEIPTEILIQTDRGVVVGQVHKGGSMEVAFGNDRFTADYREFTLTNVDVARKEVTVRFQMMATNHANKQDTRVLMVVDGSLVTPF